MKTLTIITAPSDTAPVPPRAKLPARIADSGRVRFGAGVGILPRQRG